MPVLTSHQRKFLDDACVKGRRASNRAVRAALNSLAITDERPPAHLNEDDRQLRRGLRAKSRQLGDQGDKLDLLVVECAYEQWHRLLFARFLAENSLLIHPEYRAPVTLEDCEELAESLGEPDGWAVAGRFAAQILPGIFRLDDPAVQLRLSPEGRLALEAILADLSPEVFRGDDALGWVYQFWQKETKDEVNRSERKIGASEVGPVTQLFTESYMVRFLLENSLGAWWAARHPNSPLIMEWTYLRFGDESRPAAGQFSTWPSTIADVSLMDPCCGSGHFLVQAFKMLWRMRVEEEGCSPVAAQDAVLRDNLFGLELDPRCVQIAMFALALQAWKDGGCWRELPVPNVACSGIPVRTPLDEWREVARGDARLEGALTRLHAIFRDADSLGSLLDPRNAADTDVNGQATLDAVDWEEVSPLLIKLSQTESADPALSVLGRDASALTRAAAMLSRKYDLIATNVPYLHRGKQAAKLRAYCETQFPLGKEDLASAFIERFRSMAHGGTVAAVTPQTWMHLGRYRRLREEWLSRCTWHLVAQLGPGAFGEIGGAVVNVSLFIASVVSADGSHSVCGLDVENERTPIGKADLLKSSRLLAVSQSVVLANPDHRFTFADIIGDGELLSARAAALGGITTGDSQRYRRFFWEVEMPSKIWVRQQLPPDTTEPYSGRDSVLRWEEGLGGLAASAADIGATIAGRSAWGRRGVAIGKTGSLPATLYSGEPFENVCAVIVPAEESLVPAVWAFCSSPEFAVAVRRIDKSLGVTCNTLAKIPFNADRWQRVADDAGLLPQPASDDPTQWLFRGRPEVATEPLQVGVARLVGFCWPDQAESDDLRDLGDEDGIVCLPSVRGESPAATRLQEILARAFGGTWTPARTGELIARSGSARKDLDSWLREDFFRAHCQVFKTRPFIWQVWDGRKDGFSALVNSHRLDRATLEKLTYSYLGDWRERQAAGIRDDVAGAEERLAAARSLQQKLELILEGEPPYDIYVRWKSVAEQPVGWDPDLDDGVRFNARPFVEAGILRSKFNVKWDKDRGKNPDGTERLNDLHLTNAQKLAARGGSL